MTEKKRIDEATLHAFVDGEFDPDSRREIEAWLANHPEDQSRVASWTDQRQGLKDLFASVVEEPLPGTIRAALKRRHRGFLPTQLMRMAAALLLFAAGTVTGWLMTTSSGPAIALVSSIGDRALSAHVVYASEVRHPVEVEAKQKAHLVAWLSKRLGRPLTAPDLSQSGFELIGGRLLPANHAPAAQFMYEDRTGRRITLYVAANASGRDTAFRIYGKGAVKSFYWLDGPLGYAVAGEIEQNFLPLPIFHNQALS